MPAIWTNAPSWPRLRSVYAKKRGSTPASTAAQWAPTPADPTAAESARYILSFRLLNSSRAASHLARTNVCALAGRPMIRRGKVHAQHDRFVIAVHTAGGGPIPITAPVQETGRGFVVHRLEPGKLVLRELSNVAERDEILALLQWPGTLRWNPAGPRRVRRRHHHRCHRGAGHG